MTLAEALEAYLGRRELTDEVGQALMAGMRMLARGQKEVKQRHVEDVASATVFFILKKGFDIQGQSTGERIQYLKKVIQTEGKKLRRAERDLVKPGRKEMEDTSEDEGVNPVELVGAEDQRAAARDLEDSQELLHRVVRVAIEAQPERLREAFFRDWAEVEELARGDIDMDALIARELGPSWRELPSAQMVTARNRLQQRHSRIRRRVEEELERLRGEGVISLEDADIAAKALAEVVRCQTTRGPLSDPQRASE